MSIYSHLIESRKPFSESILWQLNRDFYQEAGISAWSDKIVPHNMTSSSFVGKTYAELIFAFLKDIATKGESQEVVYILELGAGHGRLAFHILDHLQKLEQQTILTLPKYCYVLSDIVEKNLDFFLNHPQLQTYLEQGKLDVCYFDATESNSLDLRHSHQRIRTQECKQPIVAIANYFFDSLPTDLFFIKDDTISSCSVSIHADIVLQKPTTQDIADHMKMTYHHDELLDANYQEQGLNELLDQYSKQLSESYVFFPAQAIRCLERVKSLSQEGMVLLTMDKGYHQVRNMDLKQEPDIINHGSFSLWVNFHALGEYCIRSGGRSLFPSNSNFHVEVGCLLFLNEDHPKNQIIMAYDQVVNQFGPDDYNSIKKLAFKNVDGFELKGLMALSRLSAYDSHFFIAILPWIKKLAVAMTVEEKDRLVQMMQAVWDTYFHIGEDFDLALELGGLCYDLGQYHSAISHFQSSMDRYGERPDLYHNQALCFYQLRNDQQFYATVEKGRKVFPESEVFDRLSNLDMT